eukprot:CAMPEP_0201722480 /NCGR_PEP_ID=MMETSP0593-20130828/6852_1 /ASSEMBLY_ACC=CAM_ASM_000672 /TAXON_ID=267983 /ORGANISM="Skeletonema japonicum, Strain CCMP2506" /LENGTH=373 /DNA_ID=CAMNT_0048213445 /DNA_START=70 /DNA_END=1188 /DNA_ORIENTATION=-
MSSLHPKSRAYLSNLGRVIAGHQRGSSCSKQVTTRKSRQVHYLNFCQAASITDPCLAHAPIETRNYVLACFVLHLLQGNTINSSFIKSATIVGYVGAVNALHAQRDLPKPTTACGAADLVQPLLTSLRSYESVPNRREMIYDNMFQLMLKTSRLSSPDSLDTTILDWIILGRVTGARKSEWCQDSQTVKLTSPNIFNVPQQPLAFILRDFTFMDHHHRLIQPTSPAAFESAASVTIEWRFQKNNDNGEKIPFARDSKHPSICPVLAALRICLRAAQLNLPADAPLAIYCPSSSTTSTFEYITSAQVTAYLRRTAQAAFGLKPTDPMLKKWSCHSIRVTAAHLLHRANLSDSYIVRSPSEQCQCDCIVSPPSIM